VDDVLLMGTRGALHLLTLNALNPGLVHVLSDALRAVQ
jgi:hypothetical protein